MSNLSTASLKVLLLCLSILAPHCAVVTAVGNLRTNTGRGHLGPSQNEVLLKEDDIIYANNGFPIFSPVVIEEYKTIFFIVAKDGATAWKRMLIRMTGRPDWCVPCIHPPEVNKLKRLYDYPIVKAQKMMTSPEWTKAIFVRNPMERVLSAFLDKAVAHTDLFADQWCKTYEKKGGILDDCIEYHEDFNFFIKNITTVWPTNTHWFPIYPRIDEKWWPFVDFIGNFENLNGDAEKFLQSIHSKDGISAWDRWGKTGWSDNDRGCNKKLGNQPFLGVGAKEKQHSTNASEKLLKYYTPELEKFVKEKYEMDYNNPYFKFSPLELFPGETFDNGNHDEEYDDDIDYDDDYDELEESNDDYYGNDEE